MTFSFVSPSLLGQAPSWMAGLRCTWSRTVDRGLVTEPTELNVNLTGQSCFLVFNITFRWWVETVSGKRKWEISSVIDFKAGLNFLYKLQIFGWSIWAWSWLSFLCFEASERTSSTFWLVATREAKTILDDLSWQKTLIPRPGKCLVLLILNPHFCRDILIILIPVWRIHNSSINSRECLPKDKM